MKAIDLSNLQNHPDTWPSQDWYSEYQEAEAIIVQAIEPPLGYLGHDFIDPETGKRGYTGVQLRQCVADGKKVGVYAWLWFGLPDPYDNIRSRLDCVPASIHLDMRPWVDVEDTVAISLVTRRADTLAARKAADDWAGERGLPPSGGYSGQWFLDGYLNDWWPAGWLKWWAAYGIPAGSILGGDVVAHQYTSTPVDMNEILDSEIVGEHQATDLELLQETINGLTQALGFIGGDVLKPLTRKNASQYVKVAVEQIRAVCDQYGIAHV